MLREGGHRPRDARAFLSVCGLTVTSQKANHKRHHHHTQEKERPSFTSPGSSHALWTSAELTQGRERATRAVSKNKQGPSTQAAQVPPFCKGCGDRARCRYLFLRKDWIQKI